MGPRARFCVLLFFEPMRTIGLLFSIESNRGERTNEQITLGSSFNAYLYLHWLSILLLIIITFPLLLLRP